MSSYQSYPAYKDSGVEWLGKTPEHWDVKRLKFVLDERNIRSTTGSEMLLSLSKYHGIVPKNELKERANNAESLIGYKVVNIDDLVINKMQAVNGLIDKSNLIGITSPDYSVYFVDSSNTNIKFLTLLLKVPKYLAEYKKVVTGVMEGYIRLYTDDLYDIEVSLPPLQEQQIIANYLDKATTKIDTLIGKQIKLIELLNEKRQAVISTAVTRGLDSTVAMKDSGVEWLGEVPKHWEVSKIKFEASFQGGSTPSKDKLEYWNGDIFWVSPKDMKSRYINSSIDTITLDGQRASNLASIQVGSVLMVVRSGILQRTIPIAITASAVTLNQDMKALNFKKDLMAEYFTAMVEGLTPQLLLEWRKQGATVESIESEYLENSPLAVPPLSERKKIVEYVDNFDTVVNALIDKANQAITLLKERRTELISAAVMGKIDVRKET